MTDTKDLQERLRYGQGVESWWLLGEKAADALRDLEADNAKLKAALEVAEVTLRLDGERMRKRGMSTAQNKAAHLSARAALGSTTPEESE